jgi:hypothetical protein
MKPIPARTQKGITVYTYVQPAFSEFTATGKIMLMPEPGFKIAALVKDPHSQPALFTAARAGGGLWVFSREQCIFLQWVMCFPS